MLIHRLPPDQQLQRVDLAVGRVDLLNGPAGRGALDLVVVAELGELEDVIFELRLVGGAGGGGDVEGGELCDGGVARGDRVGGEIDVVCEKY